MATGHSQVKVLPPRPLTSTETVHSLSQWKINFKQYCKKDESFKYFLRTTTTWDKTHQNAGFVEDVGKKKPEDLKEDLEDFLLMLASYLPHGYITDKILNKSVSFESAFLIIEDHYGLIPSQETFCDLTQMSRLPDEPYRQFFDKLVAFTGRHLMVHNSKEEHIVDGIKVPPAGDSLSVSMLNMLTLRWLDRIHPELLSIIRTEYSKELRDNTPISSLVPRISLSIDALLLKYDKMPAVAKVSADKTAHEQDEVVINKVYYGKKHFPAPRGRANSKASFVNQSRPGGGRQFCPGCYYLGNKMSAAVNYKHSPQVCPRATSLVAMLEAEEIEEDDSGMGKEMLKESNGNRKRRCLLL